MATKEELEREFQRRNHKNMLELFKLIMKPKPREECTTREDTECDYSLERMLAADERGDDREDYEERYRD